MRVLWFTNTPSLYGKQKSGYHGGGWIESLEEYVSQIGELDLGLCFYHEDDVFKSIINKTCYYPLLNRKSKIAKLKEFLFPQNHIEIEVAKFLKVIDDFKPDLIHIFGSEREFGLVGKHTRTPVIIHIQGILNPYLNAMYPPGISNYNVLYRSSFTDKIRWFRYLRKFKRDAKREQTILRECNHFMGRTEWDHDIVKLYQPESNYYFCGEMLRDFFYTSEPWCLKKREQVILVSTISKVTYKGFDLVLKTAKLLTQFYQGNFEWWIFGIDDYSFMEKSLKIRNKNVNLKYKGVVNAETLVRILLNADLFVHPSYIDNSPNSVCEAQLLGMPVVSTNVGGVSSLITDKETGLLVPANDPFYLASKIIQLLQDPQQRIRLGEKARNVAIQRHKKATIYADLFQIYNAILN